MSGSPRAHPRARTGTLRRRALWAGLAFALWAAAAALVAAQEPRPITLRLVLWLYGYGAGERALLDDVQASFMRSHKQVQVRLSTDSWTNAPAALRVWLGTTDEPADIILLRDAWFHEVLTSLLPVDDYFSQRELDALWPAAVDRCRCEGRTYGIPWIIRTKALYYRADLLRRADKQPPKTWGELVDVARAIAQPPQVYGFGLPGAPNDGYTAETFLLPIWAEGGSLARPEGKWALGEEVLKGLDTYATLVQTAHVTQPEVCTWHQRELEVLFASGRLGLLISEPWLTQFLDEYFGQVDYGVAPVPGGDRAITQLSVDMLCVSKATRHPELACDLIRQLCAEPTLGAVPPTAGIAANRQVAERAAHRAQAKLGPFVSGLATAKGVPLDFWADAEPYLSQLIFEVVSGRKLPESALRDLGKRGVPVDLPPPPPETTAPAPTPGPTPGPP